MPPSHSQTAGRWQLKRTRMRTTLLFPLITLAALGMLISLLLVRTIVEQQIRGSLATDLQHSVSTYQNLQRQRQEWLFRESALLADLPSLKALMTTHDQRTIEDGGAEFWKISGGDIFALLDTDGSLISSYNRGAALDQTAVADAMRRSLMPVEGAHLLTVNGRLFEISAQPVVFGPAEGGTPLGYVVMGYALDERISREVSEAADADVAFVVDGAILASTLKPSLQSELSAGSPILLHAGSQNVRIKLGGKQYLATSTCLLTDDGSESKAHPSLLVVVKSFDQATQLVSSINRWVAAIGISALIVGALVILSISRTMSRPLEALAGGARALGQGNFDYQLSDDGSEEVRELSQAFDRMRIELRRTQKDLLDSERLATIGRMASSISHDLRHYLSAMYANAEFMSDANLAPSEREELFNEIRSAVKGMTDLLDSLLLFTQTGRALHPEFESVAFMIQRAASLVRSHPDARDVSITLNGLSSLEIWMDSRKLGRAIYNLLLNGAQASKRGTEPPSVTLTLSEDAEFIRISVGDTGTGVPESIRQTMFLPFVSAGKVNGLGLGLTLAQQIAQEHGGHVTLERSDRGQTLFTLVLAKSALEAIGRTAEKSSLNTPA
jgi:signal transduction histidine kinase